jgi:xanthine/uracil permease
MKSMSMTGAGVPALAAGVIYFVIAFATGASPAASLIGGIVIAAIALAIGLTVRAVFRHRAAGLHE